MKTSTVLLSFGFLETFLGVSGKVMWVDRFGNMTLILALICLIFGYFSKKSGY